VSNPKYRKFVVCIERYRSFGNGDGELYFDPIATPAFLEKDTTQGLLNIKLGLLSMGLKYSIGEVSP